MTRLPVTATPRDCEAVTGYVTRVAELNDVPERWMCGTGNGMSPNAATIERLSELTDQPVHVIAAMSRRKLRGTTRFGPAHWSRGLRQHCPVCTTTQQHWSNPWCFACTECSSLLCRGRDDQPVITLDDLTMAVQEEVLRGMIDTDTAPTAHTDALNAMAKTGAALIRRDRSTWPILTADAHRLLPHSLVGELTHDRAVGTLPWHPATTALITITLWPTMIADVRPSDTTVNRAGDHPLRRAQNTIFTDIRDRLGRRIAYRDDIDPHIYVPACHYLAAHHVLRAQRLPEVPDFIIPDTRRYMALAHAVVTDNPSVTRRRFT